MKTDNLLLYILDSSYIGIINNVILILFTVMILYCFIKKIGKMNIHYKKVNEINKIKDDKREERIKLLLGNLTREEAEKELEEKYIEIQNALVNADYDILKQLCTNKMYDKYVKKIEVLKKKKQKHIKNCFIKEETDIIDIYKIGSDILIEVGIDYSCYDYNLKNNIVIKGSKKYVSYFECFLTFVKIENKYLLKKETVTRILEK